MNELIFGGAIFIIFGAGVIVAGLISTCVQKTTTPKNALVLYGPLLVSCALLYVYTGGHVRDGGLLAGAFLALGFYYRRLFVAARDRAKRQGRIP